MLSNDLYQTNFFLSFFVLRSLGEGGALGTAYYKVGCWTELSSSPKANKFSMTINQKVHPVSRL